MIIPFDLNGERVIIDSNPGERLVRILRGRFRLLGAREGCLSGRCGSCTVLMSGNPVPSCIVPVFQVKNSSVTTIEAFRETPDCADILEGFALAGVSMCGFCDSGKIFIAHATLQASLRPSEEDIRTMYAGNICRCTSVGDLIAGVRNAGTVRRKRLNAK